MIRRRELIAGVSAAVTPVLWPLAARAQQPGIPVIGFLGTSSPEAAKDLVSAFRRGLRDAGYFEGQNVAIEFRWGNGQGLRVLRQPASELVRLQVAVIVAVGAVAAPLAAKAATSTIPIIVAGGADPVKYGLAASLNQPGGNVTGVTYLTNELAGKRLDLLLKLVPQATTVGYIVPDRSQVARDITGELLTAARVMGREIILLECRAPSDFDTAFATMAERQAGAVVVEAFTFAFDNREKIVALAAHHKIPAIYPGNQYVHGGGLMSYGAADFMRQVVNQYVVPILKGAKPGDLPIQQPTNLRLDINLKTAKALGLKIPRELLIQANVIE